MKLVIFTIEGETLLFQGVEDFKESFHTIRFSYDGLSIGERRRAVFIVDNLVGYSVSKERRNNEFRILC